jgi:hypothetical protein
MHLFFTILQGTQLCGCIHPCLAFLYIICEIYNRLLTWLHISNYANVIHKHSFTLYTPSTWLGGFFTWDTPPIRMAYISMVDECQLPTFSLTITCRPRLGDPWKQGTWFVHSGAGPSQWTIAKKVPWTSAFTHLTSTKGSNMIRIIMTMLTTFNSAHLS